MGQFPQAQLGEADGRQGEQGAGMSDDQVVEFVRSQVADDQGWTGAIS